MMNQNADYDNPSHGWGRFVSFTFLFACVYLHSYEQLYT